MENEVMSIRSGIIRLADLKKADVGQFAVKTVIDKDRQEQERLFLRKKHAEIKAAENVQKYDIATMTLASENPKFNKKEIKINIGLGLFSKEILEKGWNNVFALPVIETVKQTR